MLLTLDDAECLDSGAAGAKAAWLARGRQMGLPVLPGVVVPTHVSQPAMRQAADILGSRGSGAARLSISTIRLADELVESIGEATQRFDPPLVVRSSSVLETSGAWSGAFTSYLEIRDEEIGTAVKGCWASAFTVHALERFEAAQIEPGSVPMGVLIQPGLEADFGGTARAAGTDVLVAAVAGSPAPLVQGWDPGSHARVSATGVVVGSHAVELLEEGAIKRVAEMLRRAYELTGANTCEWGMKDGEIVVFQLGRSPSVEHGDRSVPDGLTTGTSAQVSRAVRRAPGPMGEALVLPWAIADPSILDHPLTSSNVSPGEALRIAGQLAASLTAEVWRRSKAIAVPSARDVLKALRSSEPSGPLGAIESLRPPDIERGLAILSLLERVREGLVEAGVVSSADLAWHIEPTLATEILTGQRTMPPQSRIGFDRWEPFDAAVVLSQGRSAHGASAAPGIGSGRLCFIADAHDTSHFRPRDVVVGTHPLPNLAALLWDASALVTTGGNPAAHLFESARALAIPAVCAVHLDEALGSSLADLGETMAVAVDGSNGTVAVMPW